MRLLTRTKDYLWRIISELPIKQARRLVIIVFGFSVLMIGVVMIFLPGPAIILIPLSLAILGTEFVWARRVLARLKREVSRLQSAVWK